METLEQMVEKQIQEGKLDFALRGRGFAEDLIEKMKRPGYFDKTTMAKVVKLMTREVEMNLTGPGKGINRQYIDAR